MKENMNLYVEMGPLHCPHGAKSQKSMQLLTHKNVLTLPCWDQYEYPRRQQEAIVWQNGWQQAYQETHRQAKYLAERSTAKNPMKHHEPTHNRQFTTPHTCPVHATTVCLKRSPAPATAARTPPVSLWPLAPGPTWPVIHRGSTPAAWVPVWHLPGPSIPGATAWSPLASWPTISWI